GVGAEDLQLRDGRDLQEHGDHAHEGQAQHELPDGDPHRPTSPLVSTSTRSRRRPLTNGATWTCWLSLPASSTRVTRPIGTSRGYGEGNLPTFETVPEVTTVWPGRTTSL